MVWTILTAHLSEFLGDAPAGEEDTPIGAMPGCFRLGWQHGLLDEVSRALGYDFFLRSKLDLLCMFDDFVGSLNVYVSL
jgi:hypothetical protein